MAGSGAVREATLDAPANGPSAAEPDHRERIRAEEAFETQYAAEHPALRPRSDSTVERQLSREEFELVRGSLADCLVRFYRVTSRLQRVVRSERVRRLPPYLDRALLTARPPLGRYAGMFVLRGGQPSES